MTVVDQVVAAMAQAKQEILKLRQENAKLLAYLRVMRDTLRDRDINLQVLDEIIAEAEAK